MATVSSDYTKPRKVSAKERKEFYDWYSVVSQQIRTAFKHNAQNQYPRPTWYERAFE